MLRAALNGIGALLTAVATIVFVATKFTSGAWVAVLIVPALMLLFSRIQSYYKAVGLELGLGRRPHSPLPSSSLVIVPVGGISKLTEHALQAALSLGDEVIAVIVHPEAGHSAAFRARWDDWNPGVRLGAAGSGLVPGQTGNAGILKDLCPYAPAGSSPSVSIDGASFTCFLS